MNSDSSDGYTFGNEFWLSYVLPHETDMKLTSSKLYRRKDSTMMKGFIALIT